MRVLRKIPTPWTPYSVMFSRDGGRLAIGGGTWYGMGGIILSSLSNEDRELFDFNRPPEHSNGDILSSTVSGICFTGDDRHLAASTWFDRHNYGPTYLFEVSVLRLTHRETLKYAWHDDIGNPCPTGVLFYDRHLIVRHNATIPRDVIAVWPMPPEIAVQTEEIRPHLTSSRMVVVDGDVITGGGGSLSLVAWRIDMGMQEEGRACGGMVQATLQSQGDDVRFIPVADCRRVTAIVTDRIGNGIITGGLDGEVDRWSTGNDWEQRRLQGVRTKDAPKSPELAWATYEPASIVGICHLCKNDLWVTVDAVGELTLWQRDEICRTWRLPEAGSPRSIAAHPFEPWIAVAIKKGGLGCAESAVLLLDLRESVM